VDGRHTPGSGGWGTGFLGRLRRARTITLGFQVSGRFEHTKFTIDLAARDVLRSAENSSTPSLHPRAHSLSGRHRGLHDDHQLDDAAATDSFCSAARSNTACIHPEDVFDTTGQRDGEGRVDASSDAEHSDQSSSSPAACELSI
jgi:hypothetical protein